MSHTERFPDFGAHTALKAWLSVCLPAFFCVCYFPLQNVVLFRIRAFPLTTLDDAIPFNPRWVWTYQSIYLLLALVPWALASRDDLLRYARGIFLMSCVAFACFVVFPVRGPRPAIVPSGGMFGWLVSYDKPTNVFPSLHVALAGYTVLVAVRASRMHKPTQRLLSLAGTIWLLAIAYAAVATKQHYVIDIAAGYLLALFGFWGSGILGFRGSGVLGSGILGSGVPAFNASQNPASQNPVTQHLRTPEPQNRGTL